MAATKIVWVCLALCSVLVSGQYSMQGLWPPKCCLADDFTMTFRSVYGDMANGKNFGFSNMLTMAVDSDKQITASIGVTKDAQGTSYSYKVIDDYNKNSSWSITEGKCTWTKLEGNLGSNCIGDNDGEVVYYGSFNYMGYIPTYTWRTTIWETAQKGFVYLSVTENECLPVASNFGGYNDQVVPTPEIVFSGGNFYNYTIGISDADKKMWFTVPGRCPPAPTSIEKKTNDLKGKTTFGLARLLVKMMKLRGPR